MQSAQSLSNCKGSMKPGSGPGSVGRTQHPPVPSSRPSWQLLAGEALGEAPGCLLPPLEQLHPEDRGHIILWNKCSPRGCQVPSPPYLRTSRGQPSHFHPPSSGSWSSPETYRPPQGPHDPRGSGSHWACLLDSSFPPKAWREVQLWLPGLLHTQNHQGKCRKSLTSAHGGLHVVQAGDREGR